MNKYYTCFGVELYFVLKFHKNGRRNRDHDKNALSKMSALYASIGLTSG